MFNFLFEYADLIWGDKFKYIFGVHFIKVDDSLSYIKNNTSPVNIVTHNGDLPIDEKYSSYINKFPKWYGQNIITKSDKFSPIPIGLENDYVNHSVEKKKMLTSLAAMNIDVVKNNLLYVNHNVGTNTIERQKPYGILKTSNWCTVEHPGGFNYQEHYYRKILDHACTLSPPGNGIDCHRTWEILYLGRIPVLKRVGRLQEMYADLPVIFIDEYEDIDESFLNSKINDVFKQSHNFDKLKFSYWESFVKN